MMRRSGFGEELLEGLGALLFVSRWVRRFGAGPALAWLCVRDAVMLRCLVEDCLVAAAARRKVGSVRRSGRRCW